MSETRRPTLVVIESPLAGDVARNTRYARAAMRDSLRRGEAPYASHLLYAQPGILDDLEPGEREQGIRAGFAWGACAQLVAVYTDLGTSGGMRRGIARAEAAGIEVVYRSIPAWETEDPSVP